MKTIFHARAVKSHISGRELYYAQQIIGLTDGKNPRDHEHHQPCPVCGGNDRFWFNPVKQTFHCRRCGISGDLIALVEKVRGVSFIEASCPIRVAPYESRSTGSVPIKMRSVRTGLPPSSKVGSPQMLSIMCKCGFNIVLRTAIGLCSPML